MPTRAGLTLLVNSRWVQSRTLTYAVDGLREVMLKGSDLTSTAVQTDLAVLGGIALFFVVLASLTIKREVA